MIVGMNHFTILAEDERKTLDFYVGLLGLAQGPRPDLGFPGTWLYAGDSQAVLHVVFGRPMPPLPPVTTATLSCRSNMVDLSAVLVRMARRGQARPTDQTPAVSSKRRPCATSTSC